MNKENPRNNFPNHPIENLDFQELRKILVGLEPNELHKLKLWLTDLDAFAEDLSNVIPISIKHLIEKRIVLPSTLLPLVEEAIENSVIENPQRLANALFPIMGPAIRKAVTEDVKRMIQSMNSGLEKGFSPQRFIWRVKSWFSKRSYSDIVLSKVLQYRVLQVFLIHKRTGLLLQHVVDDTVSFKDPDMVSAMLSAINDFVQDSFSVQKGDIIETVQIGHYTVWLENGPHAILAGIVEGNPPPELRDVFKQTLEKIHINFAKPLVHFAGDTIEFEKDDGQIRNCLKKQAREKASKPILIIILFVVLLGLASYWAYRTIESNIRWNNYIEQVEGMDGVVIIKTEKKDGKNILKGMRDPLSQNPDKFIADFGFSKENSASSWQYYVSLDRNFVLKRTILKLKPEASTKIDYKNGIVFVSGVATNEWIDQAKLKHQEIQGVDSINFDGLEVEVDQLQVIETYKEKIDKFLFTFDYGVTELNAGHLAKLAELKSIIDKVLNTGVNLDKFEVDLIGYTTDQGNVQGNKEFILLRANLIKNELVNMGIHEDYVQTEVRVMDKQKLGGISPRSVFIETKIN
jgi:outer membrane protein OmpA-like peptidoglycan-associated protein